MTATSSRSFSAALSDFFALPGYVQATSTQSLDDCIYALRENKQRFVFLGGFNTRLILPKSRKNPNEWRFEMEYYRQSYKSSRYSHVVQRLNGVMYSEGGQTHVMAKVKFTAAALRWFWLSLALTLVSLALPLYTGKPVMFMMLLLTGPWLLAMAFVLWLDRYKLVRLVRQSVTG